MFLVLYGTCTASPIFFDWHYYVAANKLPSCWTWAHAFLHYKAVGMRRGLKTSKKEMQDLVYTKTSLKDQCYSCVITLHLYNLFLVDDILAIVKNFIKNNPEHNFILYINIPVDSNVYKVNESLAQVKTCDIDEIEQLCEYVSHPLERETKVQLAKIYTYILDMMSKVGVDTKIIFSDNVGQDIGGFFFLLDRMKHDQVRCDYVVKIHSKSDDHWRRMLFSMLDCKLSSVLREYDCFYTIPVAYKELDFITKTLREQLEQIFNQVLVFFNLPFDDDFNYSSGTMFIVSSRVVDFLNQFDLLSVVHFLNPGKPAFPSIEHGFELFFGYLIKYLGLRTV